jgi:hypothetical protein
MTIPFLAACSSSGQTQMTPEKFKDMVAMLLKLDELKKKEIITEAEFQLQKKRLLGNVRVTLKLMHLQQIVPCLMILKQVLALK